MEETPNKVSVIKRYNTQRSMNKEIHFYGLTGIQVVFLFVITLVLYLSIGNYGPAILLVIFPLLQKNKKKLSEGDPNYIDTVKVKMATRNHYQDVDKVLVKLTRKWKG